LGSPYILSFDCLYHFPLLVLLDSHCSLTAITELYHSSSLIAKGSRVPVPVLRETTERPEAVAAGAGRLVGTDPAHIVAAVHELLNDPVGYARMASAANPCGDGHAAGRIATALRAAPPQRPGQTAWRRSAGVLQ
jgi:UDP-N-acetylglucosamine 2-epimerase